MPEPLILLRSQIECPNCHTIIASIHRHDFQTCSCGETSIDGGLDYLRVAGDWMASMGDEERQQYMHSVFIAGDHSRASKGTALSVYKVLWKASNNGERLVRDAEIHRGLLNTRHRASPGGVRAYLALFEDAGMVEKTSQGWKPLVPLAERPDLL